MEALQPDPGTSAAADRNVRFGKTVLQAERHRAPTGRQNARLLCSHQIPQGHQGSEPDGQSGLRGSTGRQECAVYLRPDRAGNERAVPLRCPLEVRLCFLGTCIKGSQGQELFGCKYKVIGSQKFKTIT